MLIKIFGKRFPQLMAISWSVNDHEISSKNKVFKSYVSCKLGIKAGVIGGGEKMFLSIIQLDVYDHKIIYL